MMNQLIPQTKHPISVLAITKCSLLLAGTPFGDVFVIR
jgi:hypothetical protein